MLLFINMYIKYQRVLICIGLLLCSGTIHAQTQTQTQSNTISELQLLITKLQNELTLIIQNQQQNSNLSIKTIPWDPPAGRSIIDERGVVNETFVGKRVYKANPYDSLFVRWDRKIEFTDNTVCKITADYGKATRSTTLKNTKDAYDHIGVYVQVTEQYFDSNLKKVAIVCTESGSKLYKTSFKLKITPEAPVTSNTNKVTVFVTARQERYQSGIDTVWFDYGTTNVPSGSSIEMKIKNMANGKDYPLVSQTLLQGEASRVVDLSRPQLSLPLNGTIVYSPSIAKSLLPITGPLEVLIFDKNNVQISLNLSSIEIY